MSKLSLDGLAMTIREGRRRGNPTWGRTPDPATRHLIFSGQTEFEKFVKSLGIAEADLPRSRRVKEWVREHKNTRYVPEELLQAYGFTVKLDNW